MLKLISSFYVALFNIEKTLYYRLLILLHQLVERWLTLFKRRTRGQKIANINANFAYRVQKVFFAKRTYD